MLHFKVIYLLFECILQLKGSFAIIMCSDESLLQEDRSLSAGLSGLHLRDASGQTNRSSRLAPIQSHDILSSNPSPLNQRYHSNFLM